MRPIWSALLFVALAATTAAVGRGGTKPARPAWLGPFVPKGDGGAVEAVAINSKLRIKQENHKTSNGVVLTTVGILPPRKYRYNSECPQQIGIKIDGAGTFCGLHKVTFAKSRRNTPPKFVRLLLDFGNALKHCQLEIHITAQDEATEEFMANPENKLVSTFDISDFAYKLRKRQGILSSVIWLEELLQYGVLPTPEDEGPSSTPQNEGAPSRFRYRTRPILYIGENIMRPIYKAITKLANYGTGNETEEESDSGSVSDSGSDLD